MYQLILWKVVETAQNDHIGAAGTREWLECVLVNDLNDYSYPPELYF